MSVYLFVFCCCFAFQSTQAQLSRPSVNTTLGEIIGDKTFGKDVIEYLGIPYAEPPVNQSRFRPPSELLSLPRNPYVATQYKDACYQNTDLLRIYLESAQTTDRGLILSQAVNANEDCLYLNIFSPVYSEGDDLKPVMVFLHGGKFTEGTGAAFKGTELVHTYDVIVVTINYRLGVFGFLFNGTEDFSGNYGIHDQKMALHWIKKYIHKFGGNSSDITLFGEEAGGSSVHIHLLKSEEEKSFRNAIIQSAQYDDSVLSPEQCRNQFREFLKELGLENHENPMKVLSTYDSEDLYQASSSIAWKPCLHSNIIDDFPQKLIQSYEHIHDINILIGTNAEAVSEAAADVTSDYWLFNVTDEIVTETFPQLYEKMDVDDVERMSKNYLQFYALLPEEEMTSEERSNFVDRTYTDQLYKTWAQEISLETSKKCNCSVYNYLFSKESVTSGNPATLSSELPYIFGYNAEDESLSTLMMQMWTNFAKSGNPNYPQDIQPVSWPSYNASDHDCRQSLNVQDANPTTQSHDVISRSWIFWENYYDLLGFSCFSEASPSDPSSPDDPSDDSVNGCEPSVKDTTDLITMN